MALDRGKLAVISMLGIALAAAVFAWWWNYQRGYQSLEFYGSETARLIRTAKRVELLELNPQDLSTDPAPTSPPPESLLIDGRHYFIAHRVDISHAKGLLHARSALLDDASYAWQSPASNRAPSFSHAVQFSDGNQNAILAFDLANRNLYLPETGRRARLIPKIVDGWQLFINRHLPKELLLEPDVRPPFDSDERGLMHNLRLHGRDRHSNAVSLLAGDRRHLHRGVL